ncbi:Alkyl hydroperoxide reductase and/or thiol-specific antioxidant family (AhpC/TSA) protein [hydrothermal vent metagenome]|uniref:Alkyl hydroperoxide reductase and/or thiol-specific antioxidant family (AhpC/TSA) protein n=1 Tax=hydrothermal vent metagenome TaxID=652676 RepID=A0A3B1DLX6_9ZZZZ
MSLLESIFIPLGTKMPEFNLKDPFDKEYKGSDLYGDSGLMIAFTCNHCPYAIAVWERFIRLAKYAKGLHVNTVAINSNIHPDFPEDAPEGMIKKIKELNMDFPYLVDETQETAKAFKAQCTPDIFLFNKEHELIYHGRIDDNWKDESKVNHEELKEALNNHAAALPITKKQHPTMGCSIKWRT